MSKQTTSKRKKKTSVNTPNASQSFAQMVGSAQTNSLKPYIDQQVQMASYQAIQSLSTPVLNHIQVVQKTQMAMLRLLKSGSPITDESMSTVAMDIEDEALGVSSTKEPAREGDTIRIDFKSRLSNRDEFNPVEKVQVNKLAVRNPQGYVQTGIPELEDALVGQSIGDVVNITLPAKVEGNEEIVDTIISATILRVSTKAEVVKDV